MYFLDKEGEPPKWEVSDDEEEADRQSEGDEGAEDDSTSRQLADRSDDVAKDQIVGGSGVFTLEKLIERGVLSRKSLLFKLSKQPGENYKDYLERLWTAKIKRVSDEGTKGDCVALREYLKNQVREVLVMSELMAIANDELAALQKIFKNPYFDKISSKTFIAFLINEMVDRNLEPGIRVEIYKAFLLAADVTKIPSRDQAASFGLAQTVKETYYWLRDKYDAYLPDERRLPEKFKYCVRSRDQMRVAVLLAYENVRRIGEKINGMPFLKRLFEKAEASDQQAFLAGLLARAHNAGVNSAFRALVNLNSAAGVEVSLRGCIKYLYKGSEVEKEGEKRVLGDGNYARGVVELMGELTIKNVRFGVGK